MSRLLNFLILLFLLEFAEAAPEFRPEVNFDTSNAIKQDKVNVNEMMARTGSASVLPCDPIFGPSGAKKEATWYKDGSPIAQVTGEQNAVYLNRSLKDLNRNVPEVGFLIVTELEKADEGDYWCIRKDNGQLGEISRIKVAFLTEVSRDRKLIANPETPFFGDFVEIECTFTEAYPA
uniref:Ig-like domain-containing protein n=1 Tax=Panagrolaimus sp. JU765 TaxID=591449 RepID=A0AC34RSC1_9BILA